MPEDNISLIYNNIKRNIKIPNNYLELQNLFLKEFNENKNNKFSFSYISYIDKESDFTNIMKQIKEKSNSLIYVSLENKIEDNINNKIKKDYLLNKKITNNYNKELFNKEKEKEIILKSINIKEFKKFNNIQLNKEIKNKLEDIKNEELKFNEINKNNFITNNNIEINYNNQIIINKDLKKDKFNNLNPENIEFIIDLKIDSYCNINLDNTFNVFKSINNILYLIYTNKNKSIISYNLIDNKKIIEIKNAHNEHITNFRYYLDKINKRDLIISISKDDNNIKLWNISNFECLLDLKSIKYGGCFLDSACFLNDNNQNYIITNNSSYNGSEYIKIYDFKGNKIKEIKNSKNRTFFIDTYYDKKLYKNYIITGNFGNCKSYNYKKNKIYKIYNDNDCNCHDSIIINDKEEIIKLIESSEDGNIRIWNFHSGELIKKIKVSGKSLYSIILWNNEYIFAGCEDETIKLINLKNGKVIKSLIGHNDFVITLKKVIHPIYGESLISQSNDGKMKLWKIKNIN